MDLMLCISVASLLCWPVCFWWMHRISLRQNALLNELHEQGARIEKLSRAEHEMIKEVHPEVHEMKKDLERVATVTGAR